MNPMFASPETGDYTLSVVSPCVNAGDNNLLDTDAVNFKIMPIYYDGPPLVYWMYRSYFK